MAKCELDMKVGPSARTVTYEQLAGPRWAWRLVPTAYRIRVTGLGPAVKQFRIPEACLPFGLLESLRLEGLPPGATATVHVVKSTGSHTFTLQESARWQVGVGLADPDFCNANDAADGHLKLVKESTGHVMAWRMIAAASIGRLEFTLTLPPYAPRTPEALTLVCLGANGVAVDADLSARRLPFLMPPLTPPERFKYLEATGPSPGPAASAAASAASSAASSAAAAETPSAAPAKDDNEDAPFLPRPAVSLLSSDESRARAAPGTLEVVDTK